MRRVLLVMILSLSLGAFLVGCKNSPGDVFSPKSDIHIKNITPFRIVLNTKGYIPDDGTAVFTPEITSGISAMVKGARVDYYSQGGRLKAQRTIVTQVWVPAANYTDFLASGSTTASGSTSGGAISIQIGDKVIYDEMSTLLKSGVDCSLLAKIVMFGTDENANNFEITTQIPVALEPKELPTGTGDTGIGTGAGTGTGTGVTTGTSIRLRTGVCTGTGTGTGVAAPDKNEEPAITFSKKTSSTVIDETEEKINLQYNSLGQMKSYGLTYADKIAGEKHEKNIQHREKFSGPEHILRCDCRWQDISLPMKTKCRPVEHLAVGYVS
ncbi:MAG: hypothetical protein WA705_09355 [Candidatus Ozemobacteraceae bacterium]